MNTAQTWQIESTGLNSTLAIAAQVGRSLRGGEVIELVSDLGGGKTAFVRGLAQGMGSRDTVRSPSFTLNNQYQAGDTTLHHFDFYRLEKPGVMRDELAELFTNPHVVVVVEWAGIVEDTLPANRLSIHIQVTGETNRRFIFEYPKTLRYLLPINT